MRKAKILLISLSVLAVLAALSSCGESAEGSSDEVSSASSSQTQEESSTAAEDSRESDVGESSSEEPAVTEDESSSEEEASTEPAKSEIDIRTLLGIGGITEDDGQVYDSTYDRASIIFDENTDHSHLFYPNALDEYERRFINGEGLPFFSQIYSFEYTNDRDDGFGARREWSKFVAAPELSMEQIDGVYMLKLHTDEKYTDDWGNEVSKAMALLFDKEALGAANISAEIIAVNNDDTQDAVFYSNEQLNGENIAPGSAYHTFISDEQLFFNCVGDVDIYIASITLTDENGYILPEGYKHGEKAKAGMDNIFN